MYLPAFGQGIGAMALESLTDEESSLAVLALREEHKAEVLNFLAERPIQTVFMEGFIRDNGLVSSLNRGTFYGCRDLQGRLEGVAMIGHFTLVEARTERALAAFARLAQSCPSAYMILGEADQIQSFWTYFARAGRTPRRVCRQVLFERQQLGDPLEAVAGLRVATPADLTIILPVFARMVIQESGVNPLELDPIGFHERWLRRVEQNRVWLWTENGRLIFSTTLMSETPEVIYLEGIYVDPDERGKGYGRRCLSQLSRSLLHRTKSLCLFANEQNEQAHAFYQKVGYRITGCYDTIYLHLEN